MLQEVIRISRVDFQRLPVLSSSSEGQTSGRTGPWIHCPASAGQAQGGRVSAEASEGRVLCKVARRVRGLTKTNKVHVRAGSMLDRWTELANSVSVEDWPDWLRRWTKHESRRERTAS